MQTKYFGEYIERTTNALPAQEIVGTIKVRNINETYLPYLTSDDGTVYDLPRFTTTFTNRRVALIARVYVKTKTYNTPSSVITKLYNKLVVIAVKPLDILISDLDDITLE